MGLGIGNGRSRDLGLEMVGHGLEIGHGRSHPGYLVPDVMLMLSGYLGHQHTYCLNCWIGQNKMNGNGI